MDYRIKKNLCCVSHNSPYLRFMSNSLGRNCTAEDSASKFAKFLFTFIVDFVSLLYSIKRELHLNCNKFSSMLHRLALNVSA
jgi:hypothetical protein